ncbi:hypothetical protein GCM10027176_09110 [Actinoallomurus bryophytorum]
MLSPLTHFPIIGMSATASLFVEVIQPTVRAAVSATSTGRVGLVATRATASSRAYEDAFAAAPHVTLTASAIAHLTESVRAVPLTRKLALDDLWASRDRPDLGHCSLSVLAGKEVEHGKKLDRADR